MKLELACWGLMALSAQAFVPALPSSHAIMGARGRSIVARPFDLPLAATPPEVGEQSQSEGEDELIGPQLAPKGFAKKQGDDYTEKKSADEYERLSNRQKMAYWEKQKDLERDLDMREIEEYKEVKRLIDEGEVGFLPEKISNRILQRLIPFIALPVLSGVGLFAFFIFLAKKTDIEVAPGLVAVITQLPFVVALLGITYSIMSTSWDPDVEGSFLGVDEFKTNVLNLLDSLQKTKREERAKEKMKKYEREAAPNRAKRRALNKLVK